MTRADALPETGADNSTSAASQSRDIPLFAVKRLDMSGLKIVSIADNPELRDLMASAWLRMNAAPSARDVPDNAPQNTYATVKVKGKIVATLYNSGGAEMTNEAAAEVGDLQDPPCFIGGPEQAQWRAERIAKAVGGTIEKASTAITQSEWQPQPSISQDYTRAQLDAAFDAMMKDRKAVAQRSSYDQAPRDASGARADFNA